MPSHRRSSHRRFEAAKTPLEGVSSTGDCDGVASSELLDGVERLRFTGPQQPLEVDLTPFYAFQPAGIDVK
jgi:hypothetical protein